MKRITEQDIEAGKSSAGGWTRATLAGWGVPWPPPKGWRKRLTGQPTGAARVAMERHIAATTPKKATKKEIRNSVEKRFSERDAAMFKLEVQQELERLDMKRLYQEKSGDYSY